MTFEEIGQYWATLREDFPVILAVSLRVLAALAILLIGTMIAGWMRKRFRKSKFGGHQIDATLRPVIASVIFYIIIAMTLYAFLTKLGIPSTALLAVFGSAGLAIGLALKDTLGNIASGMMLLTLRPLQVGEYVETANFAGTIVEIGLFSTTFKTIEGLYSYVPNGAVWNNRLTNYGRHNARKLIMEIGVGYDTDLARAQDILLGAMGAADSVLDMPTPPECYVTVFGDSAITLSCRCWLPADDWLARTSALRVKVKAALDSAKIEIPFPQRVITNRPGK